jgi:hypothetical protein
MAHQIIKKVLEKSFEIPILLIAWRRPDHLKNIISRLRKIEPKFVYVAVDGIRDGDDYLTERENIILTRQLIFSEINWDCKIFTLFRENNLGCGTAVSSAISWFFENEEYGIILEDDCLPTLDFFLFCEKLLLKHRHHENIFHISGVSYLEYIKILNKNYYYSSYGHIWGWATWKRAWLNYKLEITDSDQVIRNILEKNYSKKQNDYWFEIFKNQKVKPLDTWDYSWQYTLFKNQAKCIYPFRSMVENIGFDNLAVHTFKKPETIQNITFMDYTVLDFNNILIPKFIVRYLDFINFNRAFRSKNWKIFSLKTLIEYIREIKNSR